MRATGDAKAGERLHPEGLRGLVREGRSSAAYALDRYTPRRRRAIVVASLLDLEWRLTDAALGMADRLIGASFALSKNSKARSCAATSRDVGRLMRLLHQIAAAVDAAVKDGSDVVTAIDHAVRLSQLVSAKWEAAAIADLVRTHWSVQLIDGL